MIGKLTDEEFKAMWYGRIPVRRIAEQAGLSEDAIYGRANRMGLPRRAPEGSAPIKTAQTLEGRIEGDVEFILAEIMKRRNAPAVTHEALAQKLSQIVAREIKAFCKPKGRAA